GHSSAKGSARTIASLAVAFYCVHSGAHRRKTRHYDAIWHGCSRHAPGFSGERESAATGRPHWGYVACRRCSVDLDSSARHDKPDLGRSVKTLFEQLLEFSAIANREILQF